MIELGNYLSNDSRHRGGRGTRRMVVSAASRSRAEPGSAVFYSIIVGDGSQIWIAVRCDSDPCRVYFHPPKHMQPDFFRTDPEERVLCGLLCGFIVVIARMRER